MIIIRRLPRLIYVHRYTAFSAVAIICTSTYFILKWNLFCSNFQALQHAKKMCKLYNDGQAIGSLCEPTCSNKGIDSIKNIKCKSTGGTKEAVFGAEWHNTRIVFKSASTAVKTLHWYDNGIVKYPTEKEFVATVRAVVKNKLNITLAYDNAARLTRLKPSYQEKDLAKRRKEIDNIWALVQDNEYLLSAIYTDNDVFPQLLGTCGTYFAVEYMEPIEHVSTLLTLSDNREDWARRLRISVQILELLEELESSFSEPFHLCDIKLEHFGFVKGGSKLKFIDLIAVYPKSVINRIIANVSINCEKDKDCDFYDCRSKCVKEIGKCATSVSNNNLQMVCERLFLGWRLSHSVLVPGLLMSQHTPSELASILRQCANPGGEDGLPRAAADKEIKTRLVNVLSEIEQSVNENFFL